jgi:hypothetical protein
LEVLEEAGFVDQVVRGLEIGAVLLSEVADVVLDGRHRGQLRYRAS